MRGKLHNNDNLMTFQTEKTHNEYTSALSRSTRIRSRRPARRAGRREGQREKKKRKEEKEVANFDTVIVLSQKSNKRAHKVISKCKSH